MSRRTATRCHWCLTRAPRDALLYGWTRHPGGYVCLPCLNVRGVPPVYLKCPDRPRYTGVSGVRVYSTRGEG